MRVNDTVNSTRNRNISYYILGNLSTLAESILQMQYEKMPNLLKTYTPHMREKCLEDIRYHLQALADSIATDSQEIFIDYISWAQFLLENLNIGKEQLIKNLQCMEAILGKTLDFESKKIVSMTISAAIEKLKSSYQEKFSESFITQDNKYKELTSEYIKTVFDGRRKDASNLIMETFKRGVPIRDIYTYIFEPALKEVGLLWQMSKITVAQEHYFTAVTQLIMSQLYEYLFTSSKIGLRFVGACVNEELHEIGIRMVADVLESEGWDTYYLGANVPVDSVIKFLEEKKPNVFGLSCTLSFHLHNVMDIIEKVRQSEPIKNTKIIVGGYPFSVDKDLWKKVGADGFARNLSEVENNLKVLLS